MMENELRRKDSSPWPDILGNPIFRRLSMRQPVVATGEISGCFSAVPLFLMP
jgi:hypothetical protein